MQNKSCRRILFDHRFSDKFIVKHAADSVINTRNKMLSYILYVLTLLSLVVNLVSCASVKTPIGPLTTENKVDYQKASKINAELAIVYTQRGMLDRAKEKLVKARSQGDNVAELYYAEGLYYQKLGRFEVAEKSYQKAIEMAPKDYQAYNFYAQFLCHHKQNYAKANRLFQQSMELMSNINLSTTFTLYGQCLLQQKSIKAATKIFYHAIENDSNAAEAYWELANIYYQASDYRQAEIMINFFILLAGNTAKNLTLKMHILEKLGKNNDAATIRLQLSSKAYSDH